MSHPLRAYETLTLEKRVTLFEFVFWYGLILWLIIWSSVFIFLKGTVEFLVFFLFVCVFYSFGPNKLIFLLFFYFIFIGIYQLIIIHHELCLCFFSQEMAVPLYYDRSILPTGTRPCRHQPLEEFEQHNHEFTMRASNNIQYYIYYTYIIYYIL